MKISLSHSRAVLIFILPVIFFSVISCERSLPTGDVEGVVLFAGTFIPVGGFNVEADGVASQSIEDGSFRIEEITTGKQTLTASKQGFITYTTEITVVEGINTVIIPVFSPAFTSNVQGVITGDFTGNPQPNLAVIMLNPDGSESDIRGTTNQDGQYQLPNVPFGERLIIVKSSDILIARDTIIVFNINYTMDLIIPEPMSFTDQRDAKDYTARKIGNQIWMEQNLAYLPIVCPPDWASEDQALYYVYGYAGTDLNVAKANANYSTYGVLYNWTAAMSACPDGWHLPSDDEWKTLEIFLGMEPEDAEQVRWRLTGAVGVKLKSASGWDSDGNGSNESGFGALPGGSRGNNDSYAGIGIHCNFWTSTLSASILPWNRFVAYNNTGISRYGFQKTLGFSVRCLKDN